MKRYFDYAATTPCEKEVVQAMEPYWTEDFGNPHSRSHVWGWTAAEAIESARAEIAGLIEANPDEIIFTSGATEANNLAIKGFAYGPNLYGFETDSKRKKLISIATEHKCVLESLAALEKDFEIVILPVQKNGLVDLDLLAANLADAGMVSIAYVNNETGVIQKISEISKLCRSAGVCLHVDAAQAFGKISINAREVDLLSISGHKIYGPKGIGALFVSKNPRVRLRAQMSGGGQERGIRSGTLPTALCVGLGMAAKIAGKKMSEDFQKAKKFHNLVLAEVVEKVPQIFVNGDLASKIPHILNLNIPFVEGESLMMRMSDFGLASGSACTSKFLESSHVITAMNPDERDLANSSLRVCFGRFTTEEDVEFLIENLVKHIAELRHLSPLWDMYQKGIDLKSIKWSAH